MGIRFVLRNPAPCRFVAVAAGPLGGVKLALGPPTMPSQSFRPATRSRSHALSSNSRALSVAGSDMRANDLTLHRRAASLCPNRARARSPPSRATTLSRRQVWAHGSLPAAR